MIALVRGEVALRRPGAGAGEVIVDCGGVGYRLAVSAQTLRAVAPVGQPATLHAQLVVRDDALALYGFASERERDLFLALVGVQSVGPKVALAVLSAAPPRELERALAAGDADRLRVAPGVGKRTAERIVAELGERYADAAPEPEAVAAGAGEADDPRDLARDGLASLGFSPQEALALLDDAQGSTPEELIAHALRTARA